MVISANEINQLLAQQQQMTMSSNAYAMQITQQNSLMGLQFKSEGGFGSQRQHGAMGASAGLMQGASTAAGLGMGGMAMAAAFGQAPRIFDPFTMSFHQGLKMSDAAKLGGVAGGGRFAAGLGAAGLTMGAYLAVGEAASFMTRNIMQGAQQQMHAQQNIAANWGAAGMNMGGANMSTLNQMGAAQMSIAQAPGMSKLGVTPSSMTSLVGMGMQSGQFRGVQSVNQFKQRLTQLTNEATQMAQVLNTSIEQASSQMGQLNNAFGMKGSTSIGFLANMSGNVTGSGMSIGAQMGGAQFGAGMFQQMGLGRASGAVYGQQLISRIGTATNMGAMNQSALADMGGAQTATSRFTQAAIRVFSGRQGMRLLGAMMDEEGNLDTSMAYKISSGLMSKKDILRESRSRMKGGGRKRFALNQEELMGSFLSQFGPEGAISGIGSLAGEGDKGEIFMRQVTGLGARELGLAQGLASAGPQIRLKMAAAARDGMKQGMGGRSISQIISAGVDKLVGPARKYFQEIGQSFSQGLATELDSMSRDLSGAPQQQMKALDPFFRGHFENQATGFGGATPGMPSGFQGFRTSAGNMSGQADPLGNFMNITPAQTGWGSAAQSMMGPGATHFMQGGSWGSMGFQGGASWDKPLGSWSPGSFTRNTGDFGLMGHAPLALMAERGSGYLPQRFLSKFGPAQVTGQVKKGMDFANIAKSLAVEGGAPQAVARRGILGRIGVASTNWGIERGATIAADIKKAGTGSAWYQRAWGMGGRGTKAALGSGRVLAARGMGLGLRGVGRAAGAFGGPVGWAALALGEVALNRKAIWEAGGMEGASVGMDPEMSRQIQPFLRDDQRRGYFEHGGDEDWVDEETMGERGYVAALGQQTESGNYFAATQSIKQQYLWKDAVKRKFEFFETSIGNMSKMHEVTGLNSTNFRAQARKTMELARAAYANDMQLGSDDPVDAKIAMVKKIREVGAGSQFFAKLATQFGGEEAAATIAYHGGGRDETGIRDLRREITSRGGIRGTGSYTQEQYEKFAHANAEGNIGSWIDAEVTRRKSRLKDHEFAVDVAEYPHRYDSMVGGTDEGLNVGLGDLVSNFDFLTSAKSGPGVQKIQIAANKYRQNLENFEGHGPALTEAVTNYVMQASGGDLAGILSDTKGSAWQEMETAVLGSLSEMDRTVAKGIFRKPGGERAIRVTLANDLFQKSRKAKAEWVGERQEDIQHYASQARHGKVSDFVGGMSYGSDLSNLVEGFVNDATEMGKDDYEAFNTREGKFNDELSTLAASMNPDELADLAGELQSLSGRTGSAFLQGAANRLGGMHSFKRRTAKLKGRRDIRSKMKVVAEYFGGTQQVQKLLMDKRNIGYAKREGVLHPFIQRDLERLYIGNLTKGGMDISQATTRARKLIYGGGEGSDVKSVSEMGLDKAGLEESELSSAHVAAGTAHSQAPGYVSSTEGFAKNAKGMEKASGVLLQSITNLADAIEVKKNSIFPTHDDDGNTSPAKSARKVGGKSGDTANQSIDNRQGPMWK